MAEYIEREAAINAIEAVPNGNWKSIRYAKEISAIPASDVAPVVHGRWVVKYEIWGKNVKTVEGYKCSKCGGFSFYQDNYCADCGAKMDEVTE